CGWRTEPYHPESRIRGSIGSADAQIHVPQGLTAKSILKNEAIAGARLINGVRAESVNKLNRYQLIFLFAVCSRHARFRQRDELGRVGIEELRRKPGGPAELMVPVDIELILAIRRNVRADVTAVSLRRWYDEPSVG